MKTATAQTEQAKPIFSHRFDYTEAHDLSNVVNAIGITTEKAKGILYMLFAHAVSEPPYNDQIVQAAINAAIGEIDDVDAIIEAHFNAVCCGAGDQASFVEVNRWADNHLMATGNKYRLIESATNEVQAEFKAESLEAANTISGLFLRGGAA